MKQIPLRRRDGSVRAWVTVDDEDYDWLMQWKWRWSQSRKNATAYAVRHPEKGEKGVRHIMHNSIMNPPPGLLVDHINRNGLDNRRNNLRIGTATQNQGNQGRHTNNTSGYKGVGWLAGRGKWRARIKIEEKRTWLGDFTSVEDAARAYDKAALAVWGDFALLNFPIASESAVA